MGIGRIVVVLTTLSIGVAMLAPQKVIAAGTCGSANNFFDGALATAPSGVHGVEARIETRAPAVCDGAPTFSIAWSLLGGGAGADGWAQGGFGRFKDLFGRDGYYTFTQWTGCSNPNTCTPQTKFFFIPSRR